MCTSPTAREAMQRLDAYGMITCSLQSKKSWNKQSKYLFLFASVTGCPTGSSASAAKGQSAEEAPSKITVSSSIYCSETANYFVSSSFLMQWCLFFLCPSTWACCCKLIKTSSCKTCCTCIICALLAHALTASLQSLHRPQLYRAMKQLT